MSRATRTGTPLAWLALACGLLGGCAHFQAEPLSPEKTLAAFEARRLASAETRRAVEAGLRRPVTPWPPKDWTLSMLTAAALHYSRDLAAAQARAAAGAAAVQAAREYPNPRLSLAPGYNSTRVPGVSPWIFDYALAFPIPTAGRRRAAIGRARALDAAARLDVGAAAWEVRARVRRRLVALYGAQRRLSLSQQGLAVERDRVAALAARVGAGEISRAGLLRAQVALAEAEQALAEAEAGAATARAALAAAVGVPVRALEGVRFDSGDITRPLPPPPRPRLQRQALLGRPDIRAALARYQASQYALQREIARQYPSLQIGPGYRWDQGQDKWSLGVSISLPLFNHNQGAVAEARARRREAGAQFEAVQARVVAEVEQALAAYEGAVRRYESAARASRDAAEEARVVTARFDAGEEGRVRWLDARQGALAGALGRLDALVAAQQALGALEDALQRPLPVQARARVSLTTEGDAAAAR